MRILFVTVGFVYSRWRSTKTDRRCGQIHVTRNFSHALCKSDCVHTHCMAQDEPRLKSVLVRVSFHPHDIHDVVCLSVRWSFFVSFSLSCFSPSSTSSLPHSTCSLPGTPSSMSTPPRVKTTALTQDEEGVLPHSDIQSSHRL